MKKTLVLSKNLEEKMRDTIIYTDNDEGPRVRAAFDFLRDLPEDDWEEYLRALSHNETGIIEGEYHYAHWNCDVSEYEGGKAPTGFWEYQDLYPREFSKMLNYYLKQI